MFYGKVWELRFIIILSLIESFNTATDQMLYFYGNEETYDIISVPNTTRDGNGLAFCSWIKNVYSYLNYFDAEKPTNNGYGLDGEIDRQTGQLYGYVSVDNNYYETIAYDCNVKNYSYPWYHICVSSDTSSITFYFNGYPAQNYTTREKYPEIPEKDILRLNIGAIGYVKYPFFQWAFFYQSNVYNRPITATEVMDMYNCKLIEGDLLSWKDVLSKSDKIEFGQTDPLVNLKENSTELFSSGPCPNNMPYHPVNCETGEPFQNPIEIIAGTDMSNSGDPASTSGLYDVGASSGNSDPGSSSKNSDPGSSSGNSDSGSSSKNSDPGSSSGNSDPGSSSGNSDPGSSLGNSDPGSSSGNMDPVSTNQNSNPTSNSGNSNQGPMTGTSKPGDSSQKTN